MKPIIYLFAALFPALSAFAAPPGNDDYTLPINLPGVAPTNTVGANIEATEEPGELLTGRMTGTVWYRWTAPATGVFEIVTAGADFDTMLAVYAVTPGLPGLADRLAFNDDSGIGVGNLTSRVLVPLAAGQEIAIQVGGYEGATGNFPLALAPSATPHDNYGQARILGGQNASAVVNNIGATLETGEFIFSPSMEATLWFTWIAPASGSCTVDTYSGNVIDTFLTVYSDNGTLPDSGQEIDRSNDAVGTLGSAVTFNAVAGQTYAFQVGANGPAARGAFTMRLELTVTAPTNDSYMSGVLLGGAVPTTVTGTNAGATLEAFENPGLPNMEATVWYLWTAPTTDRYQFDTLTATSFDTMLAVFTGSGGPVPPSLENLVGANDDSDQGSSRSRVDINAVAGQSYAIQVGGFRSARGTFTLTISLAVPPNDNYAGRINFGNSFAVDTTGWNVRATLEEQESIPTTNMQGTVWYTWTAPGTGTCVVDTLDPPNPTPLDTILAVYEDNSALPQNTAALAFNDDVAFPDVSSQLSFSAVFGRTYAIQVGGFVAKRGDFRLNLQFTPLPSNIVLTRPPNNIIPQAGYVGANAVEGTPLPFVFTIENTEVGPLHGISAVIGGVNASDYALTTAPPDTLAGLQQATFTVTFTPAVLGATGSRDATLTLNSTDPDEPSILITLTCMALSFTTDSDNDGLSDAAEHQLRDLGFIFTLAQPDLVAALRAGANGAGLYTPEQLQGLHVGTRFAGRDPVTGKFAFKFSLKKSLNLETYAPLPFTPAGTTIDPEGNIRFEFESSEDAAFFKLKVE